MMHRANKNIKMANIQHFCAVDSFSFSLYWQNGFLLNNDIFEGPVNVTQKCFEFIVVIFNLIVHYLRVNVSFIILVEDHPSHNFWFINFFARILFAVRIQFRDRNEQLTQTFIRANNSR